MAFVAQNASVAARLLIKKLKKSNWYKDDVKKCVSESEKGEGGAERDISVAVDGNTNATVAYVSQNNGAAI